MTRGQTSTEPRATRVSDCIEPEIKSPLLYQLSYRDEVVADAAVTPSDVAPADDDAGKISGESAASTPESNPDPDMVNHPPHYKRGGMECIDAIEAMIEGWPAGTAYRLGNALKYVWRHRDKGDAIESLKKAEFYLKREIAKTTKPEPTP